MDAGPWFAVYAGAGLATSDRLRRDLRGGAERALAATAEAAGHLAGAVRAGLGERDSAAVIEPLRE